ncbi:hypothetical protein HRbin14_01621 [bacterium HR14]|nr:hypothetical protein HRbin14_01621 [bacterium HR14]
MRDVGAHHLVHGDPALVHLDADGFQPNPFHIRLAPHADQHHLHLDALHAFGGLHMADPVFAHSFRRFERTLGDELNSLSAQGALRLFRDFLIKGGQNLGHHLHDGYFAPQRVEHIAKLHPHGARTQDKKRFGHKRRIHGVIARPHILAPQTGDVEVHHAGTRGENDILAPYLLARAVGFRDLNRVRVYQLPRALHRLHAVLFEEGGNPVAQGLYDFIFACLHFGEVVGDFALDMDAHLIGVEHMLIRFRMGNHGFAGDTAPVQAGSAQKFALNTDNGSAMLFC